ncbi:hypothetical protein EI94DRAFT_1722681 [Lactarius quietus]|nr:hypothetical protein EI94DRAFT_1722681 [Lactarius quietus]
MSAISSAFGPSATVILTSVSGCLGCINRMTLFSPPPTLNTSRLIAIGSTSTYVRMW